MPGSSSSSGGGGPSKKARVELIDLEGEEEGLGCRLKNKATQRAGLGKGSQGGSREGSPLTPNNGGGVTGRRLSALKKQKMSWVDRNYPTALDQLFVHKKKVEEVLYWLQGAATHLNRGLNARALKSKILVCHGPAGAGKTAAVTLCAKQLGFEVKEWINPTSLTEFKADRLRRDPEEVQGRSQFDMFTEFLFKASQFGTLPIKGRPKRQHKVVIVEDFPNTFYRDVKLFHDAVLRKYVQYCVYPAVFIVPDSPSRDSNVRTLFPVALTRGLNISVIPFNPVAVSLMVKFMSSVCDKEGVECEKSLIESIAAANNGDVRSAINTLQFKLMPGSSIGIPTLIGIQKKKPKPVKKKLTPIDDKARPVEYQKDETLYLFRALGKVLYSKRLETTIPSVNHMQDSETFRATPLLENPEELVGKIEVPADVFISFLQHNYVSFFGAIEDIAQASSFLADADYLLSHWPFDDSGTTCRSFKERESREDIAMLIASRGLMYANVIKPKREFRAFRKPMLTEMKMRIQNSIEMGRSTFPDPSSMNANFFCEILPYYCKLQRGLKIEQQAFVNEFGKQFKKRPNYRMQDVMDEKDAGVDYSDDESVKHGPSREEPENPARKPTQPALSVPNIIHISEDKDADENYVIEDFSDND